MLDCHTPLGKLFIEHQYKTQKVLEARGYTVINTPVDDHFSDVILAKMVNGRLTMCGVAEIKSRDTAGGQKLTRKYLNDNGGYLITERKLRLGAMAASTYSVPFYVIVNLINEGVILVWQITNNKGIFVEDHPTARTETRSTVNGGTANRVNAFLQMDSKYLTVIE